MRFVILWIRIFSAFTQKNTTHSKQDHFVTKIIPWGCKWNFRSCNKMRSDAMHAKQAEILPNVVKRESTALRVHILLLKSHLSLMVFAVLRRTCSICWHVYIWRAACMADAIFCAGKVSSSITAFFRIYAFVSPRRCSLLLQRHSQPNPLQPDVKTVSNSVQVDPMAADIVQDLHLSIYLVFFLLHLRPCHLLLHPRSHLIFHSPRAVFIGKLRAEQRRGEQQAGWRWLRTDRSEVSPSPTSENEGWQGFVEAGGSRDESPWLLAAMSNFEGFRGISKTADQGQEELRS